MRSGPLLLLATAALLAPIGLTPTASAQSTDLHVRAVFDAFEPAAPDVTLTIRNAPPAPPEFLLRNASKAVLELTGYDFEPFVRLGPDGVFANRRSRTFYVTQDPTGTGKAPADARPGAVPVWLKVGPRPEWRWFEGRAVWRRPVPAAVASAGQRATLGPWTVPAKLGGAAVSIKGRMIWKPILGEIRARLLGVEPAVTGLDARVLQGPIPGVIVTSTSDETVEIEGRDGAVFARISRAGVDVNLDGATARDNPRFGRAGARGWVHVQDTRVLSWLERRAAYTAEDPPGDPRTRAELVRWTVPLRMASGRAEIRGVTEWQPFGSTSTPRRAGSSWLLFAVVGAVVVFVVVAFVVVRARSRSAEKRAA